MRSSASPTCCLAIRNDQTRSRLEEELARLGWRVIVEPTGFHLLEELSGIILGDAPKPIDLVVVEDKLPGCRGTSIARGLQELGVDIPVAVIDPQTPVTEGDRLHVFDPALAPIGVRALAAHGAALPC